jgi:rhodanese-related sulfurtransferase
VRDRVRDRVRDTSPSEGGIMKKGCKQLIAEANAEVETWPLDRAAAAVGKPDVVFIDIREPEELAGGALPGAERAPRGMLEFYADPESPYHRPVFASGKTLLLYCASSGRSALAAKALKDMGLTNVAHIAGGFKAWVAGHHPVEKK